MPKEKRMSDYDSFKAFAQRAEESNNRSNGFQNREYEELQYTGLEKNTPKILRFVGQGPDSLYRTSTDAKSVFISRIIDDSGKTFKCVRPGSINTRSEGHIMDKILYTALKYDWDDVNKKRVYKLEKKDPELFNRILKNGLTPADAQYKFTKGWQGRESYVMNVIDRSQMDWHRTNKHTMLLAQDINERDGRKYVTEGISAFGAKDKLGHLFASYGDWQNYDIAIVRNGVQSNPYTILNACRVPEEVDAKFRGLIVNDPLTEEEASWERYDLDKLFGYTSATKILNRLKKTISRIDALMGSNLIEELTALSEKEKETWKEMYGEDIDVAPSDAPIASPEDYVPPVSEPLRRAVGSDVITDVTKLPYFEKFTEGEKSSLKKMFLSAEKQSGKKYKTNWDTSNGVIISECPECGSASPESVYSCPFCGSDFC